MVKYNREGDLLFTCAKDNKPNVWWVENGERLGTFNGHQGSVYNCDISFNTTRLLTGSSDRDCKLWDIVSEHKRHTQRRMGKASGKCGVAALAGPALIGPLVSRCSRLAPSVSPSLSLLLENWQGVVLMGSQEWSARVSIRAR